MIIILIAPGNTPIGPTIFLEGWYQNQTWDATGDRQESDFHCLAGYCPADTTTLLETARAHINARLVHPILCKYWLALLWKGSWSQTELSAFPCFSLFPLWQSGTFCSSLDSHHYRRYLSPFSCSRQIPFASKCIPPAQAKTRVANSSCRLKYNLAFLFQCSSWQLKPLLQSCHMSLLEELQPRAELKLCKAGTFILYILQMGSLSSGR